MEKFTIDGYEYHCDGVNKPIKNVYIQLDGGDYKPIARKKQYNFLSTERMLEVYEKCKFYPFTGRIDFTDLIPVTWTNNPHLSK